MREPSHTGFEDEFHALLGRLVRAHARFDYNIGLQLNWLGSYYGIAVGDLLDPVGVPFVKRLKTLRQIILDAFERSGEEPLAKFQVWFDKANELKDLRNEYVHGRWGLPISAADVRPMLRFTPLHWDMSGARAGEEVTMTLEDFADQVKAVEALILEYHHLFDEYSKFAKIGAEGLKVKR